MDIDTREPEEYGRRGPAWLVWPGIALLVVILFFAAFSVGAFMGERGMTGPLVPPWPEPRPGVTPTPTLPPVPTYPRPTGDGDTLLQPDVATVRLANGEHRKIVQERLSHSDVSMTLNRYSHVTLDMQRSAADRMDNLMSGTNWAGLN